MADQTGTIAAQTLIDALRAGGERSFDDARAMPPGVYTSPEFLAREQRDIFAHEWQCVGRASTLAAPGDYLSAQIGDQPTSGASYAPITPGITRSTASSKARR
jgi:hypothetical protein